MSSTVIGTRRYRPQTTTPLIDALNVRAVHAHEREDASPPGLRSPGAVLALHGITGNGGLVGGGVVLTGTVTAPPLPTVHGQPLATVTTLDTITERTYS